MEKSKRFSLLILTCMFSLFLPKLTLANELVVDENGYVGIGTTSPLTGLHIENSGPEAKRSLRLAYDGTYYGLIKQRGAAGIAIDAVGGQAIDFQGAGISKMYIAANGSVGIGTASPSSKLSVAIEVLNDGTDIISPSGWIKFVPGNTGHGSYNSLTRAGDNGLFFSGGYADTGNLVIGPWAYGAYGIKISNTGNVGINMIADPNYTMDVNGVIRAGSWTSNSDARWKENINPIEDSLDLISQLRGVTYEWTDKSKGEGQQLGVIAQEVEAVFPQVVHTDSQGYKSVEYSKLVAPLIEAVKMLKVENERLYEDNVQIKAENKQLENEIDDQRMEFEQRISKLEALFSALNELNKRK